MPEFTSAKFPQVKTTCHHVDRTTGCKIVSSYAGWWRNRKTQTGNIVIILLIDYPPIHTHWKKASNLAHLERAPGRLLYKYWFDKCRTCRTCRTSDDAPNPTECHITWGRLRVCNFLGTFCVVIKSLYYLINKKKKQPWDNIKRIFRFKKRGAITPEASTCRSSVVGGPNDSPFTQTRLRSYRNLYPPPSRVLPNLSETGYSAYLDDFKILPSYPWTY